MKINTYYCFLLFLSLWIFIYSCAPQDNTEKEKPKQKEVDFFDQIEATDEEQKQDK